MQVITQRDSRNPALMDKVPFLIRGPFQPFIPANPLLPFSVDDERERGIMGDHFLRYFNNPGQLIINVSWQVAGWMGSWRWGWGGGGALFFFLPRSGTSTSKPSLSGAASPSLRISSATLIDLHSYGDKKIHKP